MLQEEEFEGKCGPRMKQLFKNVMPEVPTITDPAGAIGVEHHASRVKNIFGNLDSLAKPQTNELANLNQQKQQKNSSSSHPSQSQRYNSSNSHQKNSSSSHSSQSQRYNSSNSHQKNSSSSRPSQSQRYNSSNSQQQNSSSSRPTQSQRYNNSNSQQQNSSSYLPNSKQTNRPGFVRVSLHSKNSYVNKESVFEFLNEVRIRKGKPILSTEKNTVTFGMKSPPQKKKKIEASNTSKTSLRLDHLEGDSCNDVPTSSDSRQCEPTTTKEAFKPVLFRNSKKPVIRKKRGYSDSEE